MSENAQNLSDNQPAATGAHETFTNDWFGPHRDYWNEHLVKWAKKRGAVNILEIGSYEGRSSCWFLSRVMDHADSRLTCVDAWLQQSGDRVYPDNMEQVFATFQRNIAATGKGNRVTIHRGVSGDVLPPVADETYDLIYVDGDHSTPGVFADSLQAFRLLKPGGLLLWDDYYWTDSVKQGVDQAAAKLGFKVERFGNNASFVKPARAAAPAKTGKKIVALVPARNEGPRIAFCLRALACYADAIVYLDDCSDDNTVATVESLAAECRVEKILRKTEWRRDEPADRNALLQAGREIGGTHFLVLDADEAFTANCIQNNFLRELVLALQPGDSLAMNWIQLWRGVEQYRFDNSVWTWNSKAIVFADDGRCSYDSEFIHTPRVPANLSGRCHSLPGYSHGLLHFQFVNWRNLLVKQAWYRCLEHIRQPEKPAADINARYAPSKDESGLGVKAAPREWLAGYSFFDLTTVSGAELWRERQILGWFEEYGRAQFKDLDIWDIDWGHPSGQLAPLPNGVLVQRHCLPEEVGLARALVQKAQSAIGANDLTTARTALATVLKIVSFDPNLAVVNGNVLAALGDKPAARWEYVRALALDPNFAPARQQLNAIEAAQPKPAPAAAKAPERPSTFAVSALVSAYSSERFIRACLNDLTGQTLFAAGQMEIIVIDAGSPQNERAIVEEFQQRFQNIVYVRAEQRETIYAAWNRGAKIARGRYLSSANTDDAHRPDCFAVMAAYLDSHPEIALVYSDQLITDVPNDTWADTQASARWDWPEYSYEELEKRCIVGSQPLWRRSLHDQYGYFEGKYHSAGDYEFWLRIGRTEKFHLIAEPLCLYYRNPTGDELSAGHSARETKEVREQYGIIARKVGEVRSVPVHVTPEELNRLPYRKAVSTAVGKAGFDPRKPDFSNTPVSTTRPGRAYRPADAAARPVVTIITPFFNTGEIFEETAKSVFSQTFQQWEWIIVNDVSTDPAALRVLERYRKADPRIKVVDQKKNSGPGAARNLAVKLAAGDYIVQLDSDDLLEPTAIEKWLWHLESHPQDAFVKGYSIGFGAKNYLWNNGFHNREAFVNENLVDLTSMIRKSTFATAGGYDEEMRHGFEDWEFWLRCASHGLWGGTVPEHLNWYRRRENHNDRWSHWDNGNKQRAACAALKKKYHGLENKFPLPQPALIQVGGGVKLTAPAKNLLEKSNPRLLMILPWMTMGGADKFNLDLLAQLTGKGWEVTCATTLTGDHSWMPEFARYTPDIFAMSHFLDTLDYGRFLGYLIQSRQIDTVLISNSALGYQLLLFLRSQFPNVTFLDYCHMEEETWEDGGYPRMSVRSAACLDLSVVSSQHLKRWMVDRSAKPDQVEVCYTNIDSSQWAPDPAMRKQVRSQFDFADDLPVILYAGRIVEQKQPRVFAETVRQLQAKNKRFAVLVAGDGPDLPWIQKFIADNNLRKNVILLGGVPNQRIRELMRAADIFFLPSQWEGIALSIFEAMACGLAVVGADVGGQRELVTPGCGHLLPKADAATEAAAYASVLADLTLNLEQARAMGRAAAERVRNEFALSRMGDRMNELLQLAQKRHADGIKRPVPAEIGLGTLEGIIDGERTQRLIDQGVNQAKKGDWQPAIDTFTEVLKVGQRINNASLIRDMQATIAKLQGVVGANKNIPLVSVVIPCYKQAHFLPEAVESVVAQTFTDWEIIIVNDGSPDNTSEVARKLIAQYPGKRIQLIEKTNGGLPAARNSGFKAGRGKYLLPLDADDKIKPELLAKLVPILDARPKVGFAYTHIQHFGDVTGEFALPDFDGPTLISKDNIACVCSLIRRAAWEKVGGYNEAMREGYEDWDFWVGCVEHGYEGHCLHEPLFMYRKSGKSMLSNANEKRERLIAQIVLNHPKLYNDGTRQWAQDIIARHNASKAVASTTAAAGSKRSLRITYLISSILGVTGGNQTLLRQAEEMRRRGHDVTIVTYTPKPDWFQFETRVIQAQPGKPLAASVPPSDVVVATYFSNAHELPAIPAPVKIYYAQGDQFIFDDRTMADTTENRHWRKLSKMSYELPGIKFVPNSRNLANAVKALCGRDADAILPVCTDQTIFRPLQRSVPGSRFRILIVGPDARGSEAEPLLFKGMQDIHDALQILARKYPHFTAVRMSGTPPEIFAKFPCEFYIAPSDEMKTMLFGTAHIHVYASHYDSCPRPPQEAMAAGCAVVCTATSGAMEYCRDGENAVLVPIKSPEAIAAAVEKLIHDHPFRDKLVQGGISTAGEFPREREWNEWEAMVLRFVDEAGKPAIQPSAATVNKKTGKPGAIELPACALLGRLNEANDLLQKKNYRAAWDFACAAIQSRPCHPEGYLLLGKIAQSAGDFECARRCGEQAAKIAPNWKAVKRFGKSVPSGKGKPGSFSLPGTAKTPRLSVCLIVKNEEKFLEQCLRSVRDIASQIVVLDTGSTDGTVEIARQFKAEVHTFTWNDDFGAARNEALRHVTGDWVLSLDADEELSPEHRQSLLEEMQRPNVLGLRIPIVDKGCEDEGCNYVPRLFRNAPGLFFLGRIHEEIFSSIEVRAREWSMETGLGRPVLVHHGYSKQVVADRNKTARNLRLLKQAVEESPGNPNLVMNLGLELTRSGQLEEGLEQYRQALRLLAAQPRGQVIPELREALLTQLTTHLLVAKRFTEIVELWRQPFPTSTPMTASQHFMLGVALLESKSAADAAEQFRQCLAKRGQPALSPVNKDILKGGPRHCLARALVALDKNDEAEAAFREALAEDSASRLVRFDFAVFHFQQGRGVDALKLANELIASNRQDLQAWQFGGQVALSRPDYLEFAQDWTGEAVKEFPKEPSIMAQRAEALLLNQRLDLALPFWSQIETLKSARYIAALTLCQAVQGECHRNFSPPVEKIVSQEFLRWYRHLIAFKANTVVKQINEKLDDIRVVLPSAVEVLDTAMKKAEMAMAI